MGVYVFAPAGPDELQNNILEKCVEYIGSKQIGGGSNIAKGRRYLKRELNCSSRAIKRTISKRYKVILNKDFQTYGIAVYYFHSNFCVKIVEQIIYYIKNNADNTFKNNIFGKLPTGEEYLELSYGNRLGELKWVCFENYQNQGKEAQKINDQFVVLKNNLNFRL